MLEIKNYSKSYGDKEVVHQVNLKIADGEIYGIVGHNGAGKTTIIKSVVGIHDFNAGEIFINGKSVKDDSLACKKMTAYIPDNPDLYDSLTGIRYLNFIGDIYQVDERLQDTLIRSYADAFEMQEHLGDAIGSYSHGMKQKLNIIAALLHQPKLLVLDEPFVGLDPKASHTLKQIMKEMCAQGCSIFFSSHVLEVVEKLCDRIAIIKEGRIVAEGKMEDIVSNKSLEEVFLELSNHA